MDGYAAVFECATGSSGVAHIGDAKYSFGSEYHRLKRFVMRVAVKAIDTWPKPLPVESDSPTAGLQTRDYSA